MASSRFLSASLLLHVVLIALLGSVVLFKSVEQHSTFVSVNSTDGFFQDSEDEGASEEISQEFSEPAGESAGENTASPQSAISALADISGWSTTASMDQQSFGTTFAP